ncbi:hypothetical protein HMPREF0645_1614 [Hallella bergensis DSM 17361]|uniref:Uncharacterized protein n=1 Tax=Hallella bergensis DSM 17361 TaxID=585502 RepID=D1PXC9_9BACT|nr:hypothetical protein HMPREF0645_1614 [Hallella bergensis DSM 17361]
MNGDNIGEGWLHVYPSLVLISCQYIMYSLSCVNDVRMRRQKLNPNLEHCHSLLFMKKR